MLRYKNMPARVANSYMVELKNHKWIEVHDLVYDHHKPFIIARGVQLNEARTKVID